MKLWKAVNGEENAVCITRRVWWSISCLSFQFSQLSMGYIVNIWADKLSYIKTYSIWDLSMVLVVKNNLLVFVFSNTNSRKTAEQVYLIFSKTCVRISWKKVHKLHVKALIFDVDMQWSLCVSQWSHLGYKLFSSWKNWCTAIYASQLFV